MANLRIAPRKRQRKKNAGGMAITSTVVAALRAMRRYGRITIAQCAAAGGTTDRSGWSTVKRMERHKLAHRLKLEHAWPKPPHLIGLTVAGNHFLARSGNDHGLPDYLPPAKSVLLHKKTPHKMAIIDAMIAAERDMPAGFRVDQIKVEFRKDRGFGRYATRDELPSGKGIKPDAVLTVACAGDVVAQMIEVDMGSETITTFDPNEYEKCLLAKMHAYWRYLASGRVCGRFGATVPAFHVLFVVRNKAGTLEGSETRISSIIKKIDWAALVPIGGLAPADVFLFSTHQAALASFYGRHWVAPGRTGRRSPLAVEVITDVAA